MSEKRFVLSYEKGNEAIFEDRKDVYPKRMTNKEVENKLNEQQATIEMYQRRVDKREEQISIIKKHCLKFLTDEQFKIIRKELENE